MATRIWPNEAGNNKFGQSKIDFIENSSFLWEYFNSPE
jgi:hypothetical protein